MIGVTCAREICAHGPEQQSKFVCHIYTVLWYVSLDIVFKFKHVPKISQSMTCAQTRTHPSEMTCYYFLQLLGPPFSRLRYPPRFPPDGTPVYICLYRNTGAAYPVVFAPYDYDPTVFRSVVYLVALRSGHPGSRTGSRPTHIDREGENSG